jgi:hypothetical protein
LGGVPAKAPPDLEALLAVDAEARQRAARVVAKVG